MAVTSRSFGFRALITRARNVKIQGFFVGVERRFCEGNSPLTSVSVKRASSEDRRLAMKGGEYQR